MHAGVSTQVWFPEELLCMCIIKKKIAGTQSPGLHIYLYVMSRVKATNQWMPLQKLI